MCPWQALAHASLSATLVAWPLRSLYNNEYTYIYIDTELVSSTIRLIYLLLFFGPGFPAALPAPPLLPNPRPFGAAFRCFPGVIDVVNIALLFNTCCM